MLGLNVSLIAFKELFWEELVRVGRRKLAIEEDWLSEPFPIFLGLTSFVGEEAGEELFLLSAGMEFSGEVEEEE